MHMTNIKIALIDDHPMLVRGLQDMLESATGLTVTGSYLNAAALLAACADTTMRPDILLMDISMPEMNGEELAERLQRECPEIAIIVFTNMKQRYYLRSMIQKGVRGYVLKSSSEDTLLEAIRHVYEGKVFFDPLIREEGIKALKTETATTTQPLLLSEREKEVLQLLSDNYNSNEIADKLFISKRTVDFHRANLVLKLDVKGRANLVKKAMDLGLIK